MDLWPRQLPTPAWGTHGSGDILKEVPTADNCLERVSFDTPKIIPSAPPKIANGDIVE